MTKSWLQTHPHIMRFTYAGVALVLIISLVFTFGRDTVRGWIEGLARSQGYEITAIVEEPEAEETTQ